VPGGPDLHGWLTGHGRRTARRRTFGSAKPALPDQRQPDAGCRSRQPPVRRVGDHRDLALAKHLVALDPMPRSPSWWAIALQYAVNVPNINACPIARFRSTGPA
jgi:hypothetical protein